MRSQVLPLCLISFLSKGILMAALVEADDVVGHAGERMLGDTPRARVLVRRRVFASQLEIWPLFSPVSILSSSFSSSVGYGLSLCWSIQSFRILTAVRGNLVPVLTEGRSSSMSCISNAERSNDFRAAIPVTSPLSISWSSCTTCNVSITTFGRGPSTKEHERNKAEQGEQNFWPS